MVENKKNIWRGVAVLCFLVWSIVFFAMNAFPEPDINDGRIQLIHNNALYSISIILSLALIFFPLQFYLYSAMCWLWGIINLLAGSTTNGLLMYVLGCLFIYKSNFFVNRTPMKYIILLLSVIAIAFQSMVSMDALVATAMDILFLLIFFTVMYFKLVNPLLTQKNEKVSEQAEEILRLKEIITNKTFNAIEQDNEKCFDDVGKVNLSVLTEDEILILAEVLDNKMLKIIAQDRNVGESVIKKQVPDIYRKLGISRKNLFQLHRAKKLIFPE